MMATMEMGGGGSDAKGDSCLESSVARGLLLRMM